MKDGKEEEETLAKSNFQMKPNKKVFSEFFCLFFAFERKLIFASIFAKITIIIEFAEETVSVRGFFVVKLGYFFPEIN